MVGETMEQGVEKKRKTTLVDLTRRRFGKLIVVALVPERNPRNGNTRWLCQCDCGNQVVVDAQNLKRGTTRSCGCLRREVSRQKMLTDTKLAGSRAVENFVNEEGIQYSHLHKSKKNKTGVIGVSFDKSNNMYVARLMLHHEYVLNRAVETFEEAVKLRKQAEQRYLHSGCRSVKPIGNLTSSSN
jgi:hypothetical protein